MKILTALLLGQSIISQSERLQFCISERQLLILSSSAANLALLTESLHYLLCPFSWAHTYAPLLPPGPDHERPDQFWNSVLDAPVPYIMGINPTCPEQKEQFKGISEILGTDTLAINF